MNWLDWLIIAVLVLSSLHGLRSGFLASVAKLAGIIAGLWVAFTYHHSLAFYLSSRWNVDEKILSLVEGILKLWAPGGSALPPGFPAGGQHATALNPSINMSNSLSDYLAVAFAGWVLDALSFLVLLLAAAWMASLAGRILTEIAGLCFLGPFNRLGGILFGLLRGIAIVMIILMLLAPFQLPGFLPGISPEENGIPRLPSKAFTDSKLLPYFEPFFKAIGRPLPFISPGGTYNIGKYTKNRLDIITWRDYSESIQRTAPCFAAGLPKEKCLGHNRR